MTKADKTATGGGTRRYAAVLATMAVLGALAIPLITGSAASSAAETTTTCVNYPAGRCVTTTTAPHGTTSTTTHHVVISLTISYSNGIVTWQACLGASAAGTTVQLYLNGFIQSVPGGSGQVLSNGCTTDPSFPICLSPQHYLAEAVDQPFGSPTATLDVASSGCANPVTLGSATTPGSPAQSGGLAFTGTDVALLLLFAALLIVVGYSIVRLNKQRRRAS